MSGNAVTWSFDPWRETPRRATAGLLAALACAALPMFAGLPMFAALVLAVCGFGAFHDRLMPVRCRVDDSGVERRIGPLSERRRWDDLREARWGGATLWLSPFRGRHVWARFRTLELPLPHEGRGPLREALAETLGRHGL